MDLDPRVLSKLVSYFYANETRKFPFLLPTLRRALEGRRPSRRHLPTLGQVEAERREEKKSDASTHNPLKHYRKQIHFAMRLDAGLGGGKGFPLPFPAQYASDKPSIAGAGLQWPAPWRRGASLCPSLEFSAMRPHLPLS